MSGHEYQDGHNLSAEIRFSGKWPGRQCVRLALETARRHVTRGNQGELQLDIELESAGLRVTKHYVVYPGTPVIREWMTLENLPTRSVRISHVEFLHSRVLVPLRTDLQFNYLTGGGNYNGSQLLKTEP